MKCHHCGYDLPATAKFCRSCGVKQTQAVDAPSAAPIPAPPPCAAQAAAVASQAPPATAISPKASTPRPQAPLSKCRKCGKPMPADVQVCGSCGAKQSESSATPIRARTGHSSKAASYAVIGVLVVALIGGVGYWGWTQKKAADAQAVMVAKQQADEQKRKADAEEQRKLQEAEEKGRKEAEEKAKQEAAQKAAEAPPQAQAQAQPQPAVDNLLERTSQCKDFQACFNIMLMAVLPRKAEAIQAAATRIGELNKAQRGDRKIARSLNAKGLDEFKNNNFAAAIDLLKKAAAADPADVEILSNLGFVLTQANRVADAGSVLGNALTLDPRRTSTWIPIAEVLGIDGKSDLAVRALLLGYEFSANKDKSVAFFEDKSNTAEREAMRPIYAAALQNIQTGQMN